MNPTHVPKPRWTTRRMVNTGFYAVVGAVTGPGLLVVWTGAVLAIVVALLRLLWDGGEEIPVAIVVSVVSVPIPYLILRSAAYGTCKRHPTAPTGIAIGIAMGIVLAATPAFFQWFWFLSVPCAMLVAALFAHAGYRGGTRALRESMGPMRAGVGDLCAHCGYDLSATAEGAVCPECGGIMRYQRGAKLDTRRLP